jgi:protein-disulfide isomerase
VVRRQLAIWLCVGGFCLGSPAEVSAEESFSSSQKIEIERLIQEYLISHPEIILESVQNYRERQETERIEQGASNLKARKVDLERDPETPVAGNSDGDVTLVEFFDYNCGYCKTALTTIRQLLAEDLGVRLVLKEFPILSEGSEYAARAALAARVQGRYFEFHNSLMEIRGQISEEVVLEAAVQVGLDVVKLKKDMESESIISQLESNRELARSLNINGTPTFVVGDQIIPGAVDAEALRGLIREIRIKG